MHAHRLPKNTLVTGTLYYIELPNKFETDKFLDWLEVVQEFPFSIYLMGVTYTFTDSLFRDMFVVGFNAGMEASDANDSDCIFEGL